MNEHTPAISVPVEEAEARFAELVDLAATGRDVRLTRDGRPYARIVAEAEAAPKLPRVGAFEGQFSLPDDWDEIRTGFEAYR